MLFGSKQVLHVFNVFIGKISCNRLNATWGHLSFCCAHICSDRITGIIFPAYSIDFQLRIIVRQYIYWEVGAIRAACKLFLQEVSTWLLREHGTSATSPTIVYGLQPHILRIYFFVKLGQILAKFFLWQLSEWRYICFPILQVISKSPDHQLWSTSWWPNFLYKSQCLPFDDLITGKLINARQDICW